MWRWRGGSGGGGASRWFMNYWTFAIDAATWRRPVRCAPSRRSSCKVELMVLLVGVLHQVTELLDDRDGKCRQYGLDQVVSRESRYHNRFMTALPENTKEDRIA